jgi:ABC-type transport system involved in multi-copper enzyme maturation permease subunit
LWILGVGIAAGFLVVAAVLLVLGVLSLIPGLGTLADNARRGQVASLVLGLIFSGVLLGQYFPQADAEYRTLMIVPLVAIGLVLGFAVVYGMWRRTMRELWTILTEGTMTYLLSALGLMMVIGLAVTPLASNTRETLASLPQYNWLDDGEQITTFTVPAADVDADPDQVPFRQYVLEYDPRGVESVEIETNRTIIVGDAESPEDFMLAPTRIDPDAPFRWQRGGLGQPPLSGEASEGVWIQNREIDDAEVTFRIVSKPPVREVSSIVLTAVAVALLIFGYIAFRQAAPRVAAIAQATAKSEMAQPLYLVLIVLGIVAMPLFMILPFHTLGEDIKLMKDSGMVLIMVFGLIQAVWSAGTSVSEEIEGRTALTVLSKPVSRRSFLLGKYTGILMTVLVLFVVLGLVLMVVTAYKPTFEARENATDQPGWQACNAEMFSVVPALGLYFMETLVIAAIGVALATRLAMLANFVVCATVYVVGNLTSSLVESPAGQSELVGFIGKLIAVVIPNLNTFNVQAAVDVGNPIPVIYLAGAFNYLVCFGIMALMVALLLFEDRDLA